MLRNLLDRIRSAGLTVRPSKCAMGRDTVEFLGHKIGGNQVWMDTEKLNKIAEAPVPITKKQVRAFLGLTGFYRKFIPNYADVAVPLTDLTKKRQPNKVIWGAKQQESFENLKRCLGQAPILRLPDFTKPFVVQADASDAGIGAVLMQNHEDGMFPVRYVSRKLLEREKNYSTIERECLAIVFAVKKFNEYLYGKEFVLQTDHLPLTHIQRSKTESGRIMRWALYLQNFKFQVQAVKGIENVAADYMSRA